MNIRALPGLIALGLAFGAMPAAAHHSYAMFDQTKVITISGTIKDFQWVNPHSLTYLYVAGDDGEQVMWTVEGRSPAEMRRLGWQRTSLKPGDKVTITLHPLRDGRTGGEFVEVMLSDGKILSQENSPSIAAGSK